MIKNVLTHIDGVGLYGAVSITLFFVVFIGAIAWALLLRKSVAHHAAQLPLEDTIRPQSKENSRHE